MENNTKPKVRFSVMRVWMVFAIPLFVIGIIYTLFQVGYSLREWQGRRMLSQAIEDLNQKGIPTDSESLELVYDAATSDADTEAWLDLFEKLKSPEFKEATRGIPHVDSTVELAEGEDIFDTPRDWKYSSAAIRVVDMQRAYIEQIRQLAAAPQPVRFPIYFESMNTLLPEVQDSRGLARLICLDAQVAIYLGDSQRAFDDFVTLHHLVRHVETVPFSICLLVTKSIKSMALSILQRGIEQDLFTDIQLEAIDKILLENCDIGEEWRMSCERDLGMFVPVFLDPSLTSQKKTKALPARGHDGVFYIELMTRLAQIPTTDWDFFYKSVCEEDVRFRKEVLSWRGMIDLILTSLVAPSISTLAEISIDRAQHYRQARHGVAIRLFQHKHGKLPVSLSELSPFDPDMRAFRQQPFGYRLTPSGATLWGGKFDDDYKEIPLAIPSLDTQTIDPLYDRNYVWNLELKER